MNIGTIIDAAATGDPARAALIIDGRTICYGELAAAVERCAAGLTASGLAGRARRGRRRRQACCRSQRCSARRGSVRAAA